MGAPKQKWTSEEEEALRAGVAKHGTGKWKNIQKDPEFGHCLAARSNIDLKVYDFMLFSRVAISAPGDEETLAFFNLQDKWRNMSVSASGQGSREKFKTPKLKALPPIPLSYTAATPLPLPAPQDASVDKVMDHSKSPAEGKVPPRYNGVIFEALSSIKDPNGSDISSIIGYIEQRQEVPQNFRRLLSSKLRRLVSQNKLEKIDNCYKIKKDVILSQKTTFPKQKDEQQKKQMQSAIMIKALDDEIEEAAKYAAYMIADAENKSFMATEAVKEAERVAKMAEDSDSLLQLAQQIYQECTRGEIVMMA